MRTLLSNSEKAFRILIVDDQPSMTGTVALIVAMLGYEAIQTHSPHEAIERLRNESVDLLLSDYEMPSMTGLELVAQVRQEDCLIPVILMSGHVAAIDRIRAKQLGVVTILEKPFGVAVVQEALERAFM